MLKEVNEGYLKDRAEEYKPETIDLEAEGITCLNGLVYSQTEEGVLRMDVLYDEEKPGPRPVIVWVHGGGFTEEKLTRKSRPEKRFLTIMREGYAFASIDYHLSQVRPFPSQIQDIKCAVRYLRAHADILGIDPDRIGVWGESCGGQLAALMSVQGGIEGFEDVGGYEGISSDIKAAVSWYGALDVMEFHNQRMEVDEVYPKRFEIMYGGKPEDKLDLLKTANPLTYAGDRDICPLLAMCSDSDPRVPWTVNLAFCKKVTERGGIAEFHPVPLQGHGYFEGEEYDKLVREFIYKYL